MSFVQPKTNPARLSTGVAVAIVFHIVLVWALMNGLASKVVKAITEPIETKIIEEIKPPPPPPKVIDLPPPPKFTPPPLAFVPPPEIQIQTPAPVPPSMTATTAQPAANPSPPAPSVEARPAPAPTKITAAVACSNYSRVMGEATFPRAATRLGLEEGEALIQFTLTPAGEIRDIRAIKASHPSFAENSIRLVGALKCSGRGTDVQVQVPFAYKVE